MASPRAIYDITVLNEPRARALFVVSTVFLVVSLMAVILRVLGRRMKKLQIEADDWTIFVAEALVAVMYIDILLAIFNGGLGQRMRNADHSQVVYFLKMLVSLQFVYGIALGLVRISICLFLIRIFNVRPMRIACWTTISFIILWSLMICLSSLLLCQPFRFHWDKTIPGGHCGNQNALFIAVATSDLMIDVVLFILPQRTIWRVHTSIANRAALAVIFGMGIFTMIVSALRLKSVLNIDVNEVLWTSSTVGLWSFLEPAIGVIVACLPMLRPLMSLLPLGSLFSNTKSRTMRSGTKSNIFDGERVSESRIELRAMSFSDKHSGRDFVYDSNESA